MVPRQMRETFRPVEPRLTYCIRCSFECCVSFGCGEKRKGFRVGFRATVYIIWVTRSRVPR